MIPKIIITSTFSQSGGRMIIDVHSHAWQYPEHFTDQFRQQAAQVTKADGGLDLAVTYAAYRAGAQNYDPSSLAARPDAQASGLTTAMSPITSRFLSLDPTQDGWEQEMAYGHQELGLKSLMLVQEYGVWHKLLFGSDYPFTTTDASIEGLYGLNKMLDGTALPRLNERAIDALIHRDSLDILGL